LEENFDQAQNRGMEYAGDDKLRRGNEWTHERQYAPEKLVLAINVFNRWNDVPEDSVIWATRPS
jgi:hypothetical protein